MKQFSFLIWMAILSVSESKAQIKPFGLGPYAEKVWLNGTVSKQWNDAWGLGLSADLKLPGKWGITGSAGYFMASGKTLEGHRQESLKAWPIRLGLKFRTFPGFYLKAEAGHARIVGQEAGSFIFSPGIGIRILNLDLQARMEQWWGAADLNGWALRLAFQF